MADEKYIIEVVEKVAPSIETKITAIGKAATRSFDALRQLQTMLNGIKAGGLTQLQTLLNQSARAANILSQAQKGLSAANGQSALALQRAATEAQKTQIQMQNLATAQARTAVESQKLITAQQQTSAAINKAAVSSAQLTTAQNNAASAAQRLATATQQTAAATARVAQVQAQAAAQAAQATVLLTTAQTNATTAAQRLATEQQRTATATTNAASAAATAAQKLATAVNKTAESAQRLATETQRTVTATTQAATAAAGLTAANNKILVSQQQLITATNQTTVSHNNVLQAISRTAQAAVNLTTANTNAATAAARLATETAKTTRALTEAATATTNSFIADNKLLEAQNKVRISAANLTTAQQRLATEIQRTAVQTANAAAASDRARLAALQLAQAQSQVGNSASGAANSLLAYAKAAALAIGTAMGAESILKTADAYTTMQNKLRNVAVDQASVNKLTNEMFELSDRTGQSVTATTGAFQKFDMAMLQMGKGQAETLRLVETLNKATVISGATTTEAAAGILQLGQAFGSGRLQGDEFRSIMENLPVVADLIAKSMGKTRGELKLLSSQGKITAEIMAKAFAEAAIDIDLKFGGMTLTLAQNWQIFNNKFTQWVGELNKSIGLTSTLSGWIKTLGENLDVAAVSLAVFSSLLLVAFGPALLGMVATATKALWGFSVALAANPIGLLIVGIISATAFIATFGDEIMVAGEGFVTLKDYGRAALSFIVDGFNTTVDFVKSAWFTMIDFLNERTGGMAENFRDIFGLIANGAKMHANLIIAVFVSAVTLIYKQWQTLPDLMRAVFANIVNFGAAAVETLVNSWQIGLRSIASIAGYVAPNMADSLNKALDSITLELPRMDVSKSVSDIAGEITSAVGAAFKKDYLGDAFKAFKSRALDMSVARLGNQPSEGSLRGESDIAKKTIADPKAQKAAEKRAMALAKINAELDSQLKTMFTLNPQRAIDQQFSEIEIQLASKKITLNEGETKSLKDKIKQINDGKQLQQTYDAIYEDSIKVSRDYNNTLEASIMLLDAGYISSDQYQKTVDKAIESHANALDPMRQFNKGLKDQVTILGLVGSAQDIERQVIQKRNEAVAEGITIDETALRSKLTAIQYLTEVNDKLNGVYGETIGKQKELAATSAAVVLAHNQGYLSAEQYGIKLQQLAVDTANLKMKMGDATWADSFTASLGQITSGFDGVMSGVSRSFGDFFTSFTDGFANSVGQAVVTSDSLGDALHNVAQQAVAGLISALVKLGIQYAVNAALGTTINATALATQTTASVAAAGVTAAAWAPAASLVSLASFGANSVPAMAGITAAAALSEGIALSSMIPGFEKGGYTGGGGTSDVAGVVHGQEFVMNARATAQNRAVLEAMNSGRNVSGSVSTVNNTTSNGSQMNISIVNNVGEYAEVSANQISETEVEVMISKRVPEIMASETNRANSPYNKAMTNKYAMQKRV